MATYKIEQERLTRLEVNTLIAACMLAAVRYESKGNKIESEKYKDLENKLRKLCYYGDEIATVTIEARF